MYHQRVWVWTDPCIIQIKPGNHLYDYIEKIGKRLAGSKTLFLIDDIIADETLDKQRNSLLGLAMSGQHKNHSLWLLTQSYTAVPPEHQETRKNALNLVFETSWRLGYCS